MSSKTKITIVGSGYVGMSLSALLSQYNEVIVLDIDKDRVKKINNHESTIQDTDIENFLSSHPNPANLSATLDKEIAYEAPNYIIIATPTDYDPQKNSFNTSSVDTVIKDALNYNNNATIVIKSTVPVGYTDYIIGKYKTDRVIFSPEFLREGSAFKDNLFPSRIVVGNTNEDAIKFADLLKEGARKPNIETIFTNSSEAEAIKLFANTYLAMRVSFFNELDSYALENKLHTKNIIEGICLDERIGAGYNNPSFGYGGYCLPKDTKQLLANYKNTPQNLIQAIVSSNKTRKEFISKKIKDFEPKIVGIYRLIMKSESNNFRSSAIQDVADNLKNAGIEVVIFEPELSSKENFKNFKVINDINEFKQISDIIICNRISNELENVKEKVFTRDIFGEN